MYVVQNRWLLAAAFLFGLSTTAIQAEGLPPLTHNLTAVNSAQMAPSLKLQNLDEEMVDIADLRGKVVVVNFMTSSHRNDFSDVLIVFSEKISTQRC